MKALILTVALMVAHSAFAFSVSDITGKWESAPEGSNHLSYSFQFGPQGEFTMRQGMMLSNADFSSVYNGTYVMAKDEIQATATSVEMSSQEGSRQVALTPGSGILISVIQCSDEAMTLQMGKDDVFINLQRVH